MQPNRIVLVGAGNVATHLGRRLVEKGYPILQVYSRSLASAKALGEQLGAPYTNDIHNVNADADVYIFALKDSAVEEVLKDFPRTEGLLLHTAGSLPMSVFKDYGSRYAVLYPLQTFSRNKPIDFASIPLFLEANNEKDYQLLNKIASTLSDKVYHLSSEKRKQLHLAAVYAANFVNHLYALASELLEAQDIPAEVLLPLITETAAKAQTMSPRDAQTGPAIRRDETTLSLHRSLLADNPELLRIYNLLTESIQS